jgi:hypothetical protein
MQAVLVERNGLSRRRAGALRDARGGCSRRRLGWHAGWSSRRGGHRARACDINNPIDDGAQLPERCRRERSARAPGDQKAPDPNSVKPSGAAQPPCGRERATRAKLPRVDEVSALRTVGGRPSRRALGVRRIVALHRDLLECSMDECASERATADVLRSNLGPRGAGGHLDSPGCRNRMGSAFSIPRTHRA